jgi:hypothetical protein
MKAIDLAVIIVFQVELERSGDWLLSWLSFDPNFELSFIMVIVPLILNATMLWVTDCFLKFSRKGSVSDDTKYT